MIITWDGRRGYRFAPFPHSQPSASTGPTRCVNPPPRAQRRRAGSPGRDSATRPPPPANYQRRVLKAVGVCVRHWMFFGRTSTVPRPGQWTGKSCRRGTAPCPSERTTPKNQGSFALTQSGGRGLSDCYPEYIRMPVPRASTGRRVIPRLRAVVVSQQICHAACLLYVCVCVCVYVWRCVLCHMQDSRCSCRLSVRAILERTSQSTQKLNSQTRRV